MYYYSVREVWGEPHISDHARGSVAKFKERLDWVVHVIRELKKAKCQQVTCESII
jgi:hypothetical protein